MKIKLAEFLAQEGIPHETNDKGQVIVSSIDAEYLEGLVYDSVCPAVCDEGCQVEPDGTCEHGAPSLLLKLHLI